MKIIYPVVFTKIDEGYMAYVPDMEINTQGDTLAEAISMARDAIGLVGIDLQEDGKELPKASNLEAVEKAEGDTASYVDVDLEAYRNAQRSVRRNVTLPKWLDDRAAGAGINVSAVLQNALKAELHL